MKKKICCLLLAGITISSFVSCDKISDYRDKIIQSRKEKEEGQGKESEKDSAKDSEKEDNEVSNQEILDLLNDVQKFNEEIWSMWDQESPEEYEYYDHEYIGGYPPQYNEYIGYPIELTEEIVDKYHKYYTDKSEMVVFTRYSNPENKFIRAKYEGNKVNHLYTPLEDTKKECIYRKVLSKEQKGNFITAEVEVKIDGEVEERTVKLHLNNGELKINNRPLEPVESLETATDENILETIKLDKEVGYRKYKYVDYNTIIKINDRSSDYSYEEA